MFFVFSLYSNHVNFDDEEANQNSPSHSGNFFIFYLFFFWYGFNTTDSN